jgi:L-ascorbate metabolism protein UlaG (beta-lactamase superfamily)
MVFCGLGLDESSGWSVLERIHWLGHASFRIDGPPTIYLDPWRLGASLPLADLILVTHPHYDHCSPDDVRRVCGLDTTILANPGAAAKLWRELGPDAAQVVRPGDRLEVAGVPVEVVPAYNIAAKPFHRREAQHVGYIVTIEGTRIYHTGDTDPIPEMEGLTVDVLMVPVSGTYVADPAQAAEIARVTEAGVALPMHIGTLFGTWAEVERFKELWRTVEWEKEA